MIARSLVGLFLAGLLLATSGLTARPVGAADERCFTETGKCVGGAFLRYWEAHGGLAQQGLPLTAEFPEVSPTNGKTYTVQYFERARFERHPENTAPYVVLLGLLGREQHTLKYAASTPVPEAPLPGGGECRAFASTAKQACGPFLRYWEAHGGLAQQGLPLTGVFWEVNPTNAQRYQVQYFERARFEYHPENAAPYDVLLGLLGREEYRAKCAYTFARDRARVRGLMEREFERFPRLRERRAQLAGTLSGGEQQMLAVSRALMATPEFLCLDEPSLGLAPLIVQEIGRTIKSINQAGTTVLLVEQMATMALSLADRGYVLQTGKVVLEGTGKELLRHPEVVKAYLGG